MAKDAYVLVNGVWELIGGGGGAEHIVEPEPPDITGLAQGTMWIDSDSTADDGGDLGGYMGDWQPGTLYAAGSTVTYMGSTWGTEAGAGPDDVPGGGPLPDPPVPLDLHNDMIANAVVIPITWPDPVPPDLEYSHFVYDSGRYWAQNGDYTREAGEPNPTNNYRTAWWTFTPDVSQLYEVNTYGPDVSGPDEISFEPWGGTFLYIYSRTGTDPVTFAQLTMVYNYGSKSNRSFINANLIAGTQYYISVGSYPYYNEAPVEYRLVIEGWKDAPHAATLPADLPEINPLDNPGYYPPVQTNIPTPYHNSHIGAGSDDAANATEIVIGLNGADVQGMRFSGIGYSDGFEPGEPKGANMYDTYPNAWWRYRPLVNREVYVNTMGTEAYAFIDIFRREGGDPFDFSQLIHVWANESSQDSLNGESGGWYTFEAGKDYYIRTEVSDWGEDLAQLNLYNAARTDPTPPWTIIGGVAKAIGSGLSLSNDGRTVVNNPLMEFNYINAPYLNYDTTPATGRNEGKTWFTMLPLGTGGRTIGKLSIAAETADGINVTNQLGGIKAGDIISIHDGVSYFDRGDWGPTYEWFQVTKRDESGYLNNGHLDIWGTRINYGGYAGLGDPLEYIPDGAPVRIAVSRGTQNGTSSYQYCPEVATGGLNSGGIAGAFGFDIAPLTAGEIWNVRRVFFTANDIFGISTAGVKFYAEFPSRLGMMKTGDWLRIGAETWFRATGDLVIDNYNAVSVTVMPVRVGLNTYFGQWSIHTADVIPKEALPPTRSGYQGAWGASTQYNPGDIVINNNIVWATNKTPPIGSAPAPATGAVPDPTLIPSGQNLVANAATITIGIDGESAASGTFSNSGFTTEVGEVASPQVRGKNNSAWWKYKPKSSGSVVINTIGSSTLTTMNVYRLNVPTYVSFASLTSVAGDINSAGGSSQVTISVTTDNTYYIQVGAYTLDTVMNYKLNMTGARRTGPLVDYWDQLTPRP